MLVLHDVGVLARSLLDREVYNAKPITELRASQLGAGPQPQRMQDARTVFRRTPRPRVQLR